MANNWYTANEVSNMLHIHPHTIRMALERGEIDGAEKNARHWKIPHSWVKKYSPGIQSELLSEFLKRTGISRSSALHAARLGKIKLIQMYFPWTKERCRLYINPQDPATQAWLSQYSFA